MKMKGRFELIPQAYKDNDEFTMQILYRGEGSFDKEVTADSIPLLPKDEMMVMPDDELIQTKVDFANKGLEAIVSDKEFTTLKAFFEEAYVQGTTMYMLELEKQVK
jgi:uncharacterized GH25 family protein